MLAFLLLLLTPTAEAAPGGIKNYKTVMPGVLYRGGGTGGKEPLSPAALEALCAEGVTSAVYVYKTGWKGNKAVSCQTPSGDSQIQYDYKQWDSSKDLRATLQKLHQIIVNRSGAMYVHCWYGVHASGFVAAVALRQFCGLSAEESVAYWDSHVPKSIRYEKVQKAIRNFQPFSDLQISPQEQARICPR